MASSSRDTSSRRLSSLMAALRSRMSETPWGASSKHLWRALRTPIKGSTIDYSHTQFLVICDTRQVTSHRGWALIWRPASRQPWLSQSAPPVPPAGAGRFQGPGEGHVQVQFVTCRCEGIQLPICLILRYPHPVTRSEKCSLVKENLGHQRPHLGLLHTRTAEELRGSLEQR